MKNLVMLFLCVLACACKKKDNPDPYADLPETPKPATYYGFFATTSYTAGYDTITITDISAHASFHNEAAIVYDPTSVVKVDSLLLGGHQLSYSGGRYSSLSGVDLNNENWAIKGANGIPSFNYINTGVMPSSFDYTVLPDTIRKSAGFSVAINNISGIQTGYLIVAGTSTMSASTPLGNGNNNAGFTAAQLANIGVTSSGYLIVLLQSHQTHEADGKKFQFTRERQYTQNVVIVP